MMQQVKHEHLALNLKWEIKMALDGRAGRACNKPEQIQNKKGVKVGA